MQRAPKCWLQKNCPTEKRIRPHELIAKLPELLKHSGLDSGVLLAITVIEPPSPEEELGLRRAYTPINAWKTAMGVKAIVATGPVLLAVYGLLRIGISIGVRRATKMLLPDF